MAVDRVNALLTTLQECELLDMAQLGELRRTPLVQEDDPRPLLKEIVQRGWLTRFQAQMAAQGRARELVIGPYRVLERIGEGGMGEVFKAHHPFMNRHVALKIIRKEKLAKPTTVRRFYQEIQAAAKVAHPNIVIAYDAGQFGETHYFAMEYVDGITLARLIEESGPLPVARACDYIRQAALGLQHVHECGLVHRDIKPANLLLARTPHTQSGSVVKLLDLGLARLRRAEDGDPGLTREEQIMGTPDYLAPEQAMNSRDVDIRADLYSLGCTFYFLLTGKAPFPSQSLTEVLLKHQMDQAKPLEQLRPDVPAPVRAIVRRLMAKRPEDRYQSPQEVADALAPFCGSGGAVLPAPRRDSESATEWASLTAAPEDGMGRNAGNSATVVARARPDAATSESEPAPRASKRWFLQIGATSAATVLLILGGTFLALRDKGEKAEPQIGKSTEEEPWRVQPFQPAPRGELRRADVSERTPDKPEPIAKPYPPSPGTRQGPGELRRLVGHSGWVLSVAFSLDNREGLTGGADKTLRLWNLASGKEVRVFKGHDQAVSSVAFSPDGRFVLSAGMDNTIRLWDRETGQEVRRFLGHQQQVNSVAFAPDGRQIASGSADKTVRLWETDTSRELRVLLGHADGVLGVAYAAAGGRLLSVSADRTVRLWDPETAKELNRLEGPGAQFLCAALAPNGRTVLTGSPDGSIRVWDPATGRELRRLLGHSREVTSLAFGPDGRLALSAGQDGSLHLWDVEAGSQLHRFEGHTGPVKCVAFATDGRRALSSSLDNTVRLWRLPTIVLPPVPDKPGAAVGEKPTPREGHTGPVTAVAFSADGLRAVTGGQDQVLRLWDIDSGKEVATYEGQTGAIRSVVLAQARQRFVSISADGSARLWEREGNKRLDSQTGLKGTVQCLAITADGSRVLFGTTEGVALVWAVEGVGQPRRYPTAGGPLHGVAFSPNGQLLFLGSADGQVRVKHADTGKDAGRNLSGHAGPVASLAVSFDGTLALTGGEDETLRLWDLAKRREVLRFAGQPGKITSVAFSLDGRRVLAGGDDQRVRLYETRNDKPSVVFEGHMGPVLRVAFTPDSRYVLSAGADGTVRVWDAQTGQERRRFEVTRDGK